MSIICIKLVIGILIKIKYKLIYKIMYFIGYEKGMVIKMGAVREDAYERIRILHEAGLVSKKVAEFCHDTINMVLEERPDADEEKFAMFVTHLAMGTQRVIDKKEENPLQPEVIEALKEESSYEKSCLFAERILGTIDVKFPQTERDYLIVHLCNLFS